MPPYRDAVGLTLGPRRISGQPPLYPRLDVCSLVPAIATPRAFEAILHQLKDAIATGALRADDRLPAERVLAQQFRGVAGLGARSAAGA